MARTEFAVHLLNAAGKEKAAKIAAIFDSALAQIEDLVATEGREIAIVRTKMEEACFFAKKAMAQRVENQDVS